MNNINTNIQTSVIKTLAYYRALNTPLTLVQVGRYLVAEQAEGYSLSNIEKVLDELAAKKVVVAQRGLYWLKLNSQPQNSAWLKYIRLEKIAQRKINKALKAVRLFSSAPFPRGLFICGSVARKVCRRDSDIDFLILAKSGRVWTVRLGLTMLAYLLGKKTRPFQLGRKDKFCLNHYRSSSNLKLEEELHDLYSAEEYASMLNIYSVNRTDRKFFKKNKRWMKNFLPNFPFGKLPITPASGNYLASVRKFLEKMLGGKIGHIIERLLFELQARKIKLGKTETLADQRVIAEKEVIMFHLNPRAPLVLTQYHKIIRNYES